MYEPQRGVKELTRAQRAAAVGAPARREARGSRPAPAPVSPAPSKANVDSMSYAYYAKLVSGMLLLAGAPIYCVYALHTGAKEGTLEEVNVQERLRQGR